MTGAVRTNVDQHVGHSSPTPNPFHQTAYETGSDDVIINGEKAVRAESTDQTFCGDLAEEGSPDVLVNGKKLHRKYDATSGHQSWVPTIAITGSDDVIINGE